MPGAVYQKVLLFHEDRSRESIRNMTYLWLEVSMNIAQFMKFIHSGEHLADIESCMFFLEDSGIIQEGSKVASWNIFHCQINMFGILERVKETD